MAKRKGYGVDAFAYMPYMIGGWAGGVIILYFLKRMADNNDMQRQQNEIAKSPTSNYWIKNIQNSWRRSKVRVARRISQEPEWMTR